MVVENLIFKITKPNREFQNDETFVNTQES